MREMTCFIRSYH